MILTYLGKPKYLSNKEIKDLINNPLINGVNRNELIAVLNTRIKWKSE